LPASTIAGIAAFERLPDAGEVDRDHLLPASSSSDHAFSANVAMPALALTMSSAAELGHALLDERLHGGGVAHVGLAAMIRRSRSSTCFAVSLRSSGVAIV
jgi:hypothetical protein